MYYKSDKEKFTDYLLSIGYRIEENQWWMVKDKFKDKKIVELNKMPTSWSSHERTNVYFIKNDDVNSKIHWGICRGIAIDNTDTLRSPLPKGVYDDNCEIAMKKIFEKYTPKEIYESLFDKTIQLNYE